MSAAIWYVAGDAVLFALGAIIALYVPVSLHFILFFGSRAERGRAWGSRGVFSRKLFSSEEHI